MKNPIINTQTQKFPSFGGVPRTGGVVLTLFLLLLSLSTFAQTTQLPPVYVSHRTIGGSLDEYASRIKHTADGGFVILGTADSFNGDIVGKHGNPAVENITDVWLAKFDSVGTMQWNRCYGGGKSTEQGADVVQTADGGYLILGAVAGFDSTLVTYRGRQDAIFFKVSANGTLQWQKCYGGSQDDLLGTLTLLNDSTAIAVGAAASNNGDCVGVGLGNIQDSRNWFLKINTNNRNIIESKRIYDPRYNACIWSKIEKTPDNNFIIYSSNDFSFPSSGVSVHKISQNGQLIWSGGASTGAFGPRVIGYDLVMMSDGNFYVSTYNELSSQNQFYTCSPLPGGMLYKFNGSTGTHLWYKCLGTLTIKGMDYNTKDSTIITVGVVPDALGSSILRAHISKLDLQGNPIWTSKFTCSSIMASVFNQVLAKDDTYYAVGMVESGGSQCGGYHPRIPPSNPPSSDIWLLKAKHPIQTSIDETKKDKTQLQIQTLAEGVYKINLGNNSPPVEGQGWSLEGRGVLAILTDQLGRELKKIDLEKGSNSFEIDLTDFQQGIYFLSISGYKTVKLVR